MKRKFRIIVGMLLLAIPLCVNAQVKVKKPGQDSNEAKEQKTEQEKTEKPKDGLTMPKISGFVQGMYQANLSDKGDLLDNTLRMRRVRLSVDGNLSKTVSYKIQGDFTRSPMLVDAYVKYKPCREFAIQVGQFKTPFTLESPINPVNLEIFDYGEAVQQLVGYKDVCGVGALGRDLGIMATGSLFPIENANGYQYSIVDYAVGVFNGNGANQLDNNNRKDLVGRLEVHPGLKALTLSGSYYYGLYKGSSVSNAEVDKPYFDHGARNRWSAGAQYNDGKLVIRGEYINGKTGFQKDIIDAEANLITEDHFLNSNGYYGVIGYNFHAGEQKIMPVLRYEHFAKDASITKGGTNWYTVGINYWPLKSVNCKLDYSLVQKEAGDNSHRVVAMVSYKF
ncbi:MAG: hypothetical protein IJK78_00625 [Bacteroidales bacterium]|nr:hypothetical protein [Bacteroidales bacterium]